MGNRGVVVTAFFEMFVYWNDNGFVVDDDMVVEMVFGVDADV